MIVQLFPFDVYHLSTSLEEIGTRTEDGAEKSLLDVVGMGRKAADRMASDRTDEATDSAVEAASEATAASESSLASAGLGMLYLLNWCLSCPSAFK